MFLSVKDLLQHCHREKKEIWEIMLEQEAAVMEKSPDEILEDMEQKLIVMEESISRGIHGVYSYSGLTGGGAKKMLEYAKSGKALTGDVFLRTITAAVAVNEVNASMGIICATPTAGSAGVVPAVLFGCRERLHLSREDQRRYLLTAGAFGLCIGNQASLAGAEGGCQAEIGSASAMAAAALVWAAGGSPEMSADALALALMNILGLICDPVAGLVEIPCIKRNAMGAANALAAAELILGGTGSEIPADDAIEAMGRVGQLLPSAHRETAMGGIATTKTALEYTKKLRRKKTEAES